MESKYTGLIACMQIDMDSCTDDASFACTADLPYVKVGMHQMRLTQQTRKELHACMHACMRENESLHVQGLKCQES